jgi:DNA polymerase
MVKGSHLYDLQPAQIAWFKKYCEDDTHITAALYEAWKDRIPDQENQLIDHTIKLFLNPILCIDLEAQMRIIEQESLETEAQLENMGLTRKDVRSDATFFNYIQSLGYTPPTQYSVKQDKEIPCFKKNAPEFLDFYAENPELQDLLDLKININSSIKRTRSEQLVKAAQIHQGRIPVAYNYCGAFTGRFSGTNKINLQNLPRGSALRQAITAPPGHVLVACDLSQIEVRVLAWLAGQDSIMQIFRDKKDPYCEMASLIFKKPVTKKDPDERFVGKSAVLGLGFSMSAGKFQLYCAAQGRKLDAELCEHTVNTYRNTYPKIVQFWRTIGNRLKDLCIAGPKLPSKWRNPTEDVKQINTDAQYIINQYLRITDHQSIRLPSGREISYYGLHYDPEIDGYRLPNNKKVYGALCVENLVQGTARDIMCDMLLRVEQYHSVVMHTHDELVVCVEETRAEEIKAHLLEIMTTPPPWAIGIPLDAEAACGFTYGDCK